MDPNLGRRVLGRYRIDRKVGGGGQGLVYAGTQLSVNRPVAIKLLRAEGASQEAFVQRFRREAKATAQLKHPNTTRLIDFGVTDTQELFIVMELLEGADLASVLAQRGALPMIDALSFVRQVLLALSEAHGLGIVHRDLKPSNVFIEVTHGTRTAKVMDFGIAAFTSAQTIQLTQVGEFVGTPIYMSPEQFKGERVDARSDLYSVGVMLFEMLTGRPPFVAPQPLALLALHLWATAPRLAELRRELASTDRIQALLDRLLAKEPERRPASARLVIGEIESICADSRLPLPIESESEPSIGLAPTEHWNPLHSGSSDGVNVEARSAGTAAPSAAGARKLRISLAAIGLVGALWISIETVTRSSQPIATKLRLHAEERSTAAGTGAVLPGLTNKSDTVHERLTRFGGLSGEVAGVVITTINKRMEQAAADTSGSLDPIAAAVSLALTQTQQPPDPGATKRVQDRLRSGLSEWALENVFASRPEGVCQCVRDIKVSREICEALLAAAARASRETIRMVASGTCVDLQTSPARAEANKPTGPSIGPSQPASPPFNAELFRKLVSDANTSLRVQPPTQSNPKVAKKSRSRAPNPEPAQLVRAPATSQKLSATEASPAEGEGEGSCGEGSCS